MKKITILLLIFLIINKNLVISMIESHSTTEYSLLQKIRNIRYSFKLRQVLQENYSQKNIIKIVKLLAKGTNPNILLSSPYKQPAIIKIITNPDFHSLISIFLSKGTNVNIKYGFEEVTPLICATNNNDESLVKLLIDNHADINAKDREGQTALMKACQEGYSKLVIDLINYGAEINIQDQGGYTALNHATCEGHKDIVEILIANKADLNLSLTFLNTGYTPLIQAIMNDKIDIAKLLIEAGSDVNQVSEKNWTALMYASYYGCIDIVRLLLDKNANTTIENYWGHTARNIALQQSETCYDNSELKSKFDTIIKLIDSKKST